jgi:hypothetical protein
VGFLSRTVICDGYIRRETKAITEVHVQPKTYELLGLALAGTCMGFLLPYWVPHAVGSVADQVLVVVRTAPNLTLDQYAGLGFWFGALLVGRGFLRRWRKRRIGGEES